MTRTPAFRHLAWAALFWAASTAAQAQGTSGPDPAPDPMDPPLTQVDAERISRMIETVQQGNADGLERLVALGAQPGLADPVGQALAEAMLDRLKANDRLTASRIETAVALYGSVALAEAFSATLVARTAQLPTPEAANDPAPAGSAVGAGGPASPGLGQPVTGLASHGAPLREMGPTH